MEHWGADFCIEREMQSLMLFFYQNLADLPVENVRNWLAGRFWLL
jgi:hypothetical protein